MMKGKNYILVICCLLFVFALSSACDTSDRGKGVFIYVSHPRLEISENRYPQLDKINFSHFDLTLLGGDLGFDTFTNDSITRRVDDLFDLKRMQTLWSIGNHDSTSLDVWRGTTLRNKYYSYVHKDATFIVTDSQDSLSSIVGAQKDFLFTTLDSLKTSSVVLMSHKLIFMNGHPVMDDLLSEVCNAPKGDCYYCHNPNNFQKEIYSKLLAVKNRGIQVIWVGGDLGYKTSEFEFVDDNGIVFLGNGLWYPMKENKVLIFSKKNNLPMDYEFVPLDSISLINDYSRR